jgi:DHA1 family bicyclomycin/chloramphenicol resistance-like MFS transporter
MINKSENISRLEFVLLMALMMSMPALSLDAILPALPIIGEDFLVADINSTQIIITSLFIGMAVGQLFFGPLSDSVGRKPLMYVGIIVFLFGSAVCFFSETFYQLIVGRLLQGFGVGAPRVLCTAIIRDKFKGRDMAQLMSNVMTVFILTPMVAPLLGQTIMIFASWRMVFFGIALMGVLSLLWFWLRLEETLLLDKRRPFTLKAIYSASREVVLNPVSRGYTLALGLMFGAFLAYLSTSPQVFQQQYFLQESFVFVFAGISLSFGVATHVNSRLVMRFGMTNMVNQSLNAMLVIALIFLVVSVLYQGHPPLWMLISFFCLTLFSMGLVAGNVNALSMEPLGHIAGVGSTIVSTGSSLLSVIIGMVVGSTLGDTVMPIIVGFAVCAGLARLLVHHTQQLAVKAA